MNYSEFCAWVHGKNVAVVGIGVSNIPLIKMLAHIGANVTACDKLEKNELGSIHDELEKCGVSFCLGKTYLDNLNHDIIFKTPGMRFDMPQLVAAKENGSTITSEMEVFFDLCPAKIIAVTGSDGKTTTTTIIHKMISQAGHTCHIGGNIGRPLLPRICDIKKNDIVIVELSSFQLHTMRKSPNVAVVTNLTPNHLDMHKSMEEYVEAKRNIFKYQTELDKVVLNFDNGITKMFAENAQSRVFPFSRNAQLENGVTFEGETVCIREGGKVIKVLDICDIKIPGMHNVENYMAAIAAVWGMVSVCDIVQVAKTFSGVAHRIEFVRELGGVKYYNSSIDSSPGRTKATLEVFNQPVIMIAGGKDKGIAYDDIGETIAKKVKTLILIGATADKINDALNAEIARTGRGADVKVVRCKTYEQAVETASAEATSGDVVLLSPASTSFDMFKNFEQRGELFKKLVHELR